MLTRLKVRNFKRLIEIDIELGEVVAFVGPNNSGKTSALQAMALWSAGLAEWTSERKTGVPGKRPGVTLSRLGLTRVPIRDTRSLWRELRVNTTQRDNGKSHTEPIFIDIVLDGETGGKAWSCGFEFYYANKESLYCRPIRTDDGAGRLLVPDEATTVRVQLLPPLSGVVTDEPELQPGRVDVLLGETRTGEVLRNLCLQTLAKSPKRWAAVQAGMKSAFGVDVREPKQDPARGTIELEYRENNITFDITSAGRGLQQVLLLLAYFEAHHGATLLLDEPDAHLEVIRQREVYSLLSETARKTGSQLIVATHSEVVMQEALDRDVLIGFIGKPRRFDDRGSQLSKALRSIRASDYYQAERKGVVLYLEGSTDLAILRGFARVLDHPAKEALAQPFVEYVANEPQRANDHFYGLRAASPELKGFALFDRLPRKLPDGFAISNHVWSRYEIESYFTTREVLMRFSAATGSFDDLVNRAEAAKQSEAMASAIDKVEAALRSLRRDAWSPDIKASEDVLDPIFANYYDSLSLSNRLRKTDFHILTDVLKPIDIDQEVVSVLDKIAAIASGA